MKRASDGNLSTSKVNEMNDKLGCFGWAVIIIILALILDNIANINAVQVRVLHAPEPLLYWSLILLKALFHSVPLLGFVFVGS